MIIIFGNGQNAEVAYYYLTKDTSYKVCGFTVDSQFIDKPSFLDLPVVPFEQIEEYFPPEKYKMFVPISFQKINRLREEKYFECKNKGYSLISYIHSSCINFCSKVGDNCFILDRNTLQPGVVIGNNVTIWSGNHIGHHSCVEDNVFISSHVVVSGGVTIGRNSFIGVNATVRDNIKIGHYSVIGAGALLTKDVENKSVISRKADQVSIVTSDRLKKI